MLYVDVNPQILKWAGARVGIESIEGKFKKFDEWVKGSSRPTLRQLEKFATATYTPIGYFYLDGPPDLSIPIPDFRTIGNIGLKEPSPNLLDTIHLCEQRQVWYREHMISMGEDGAVIVGSVTKDDDIADIASRTRNILGMDLKDRDKIPTWTEMIRYLSDRIEENGILVMINGVVGNNNHRRLDPREFRGFALSDPIAPMIFVNGADTKAAQVFTLAHELAHILLGETGISIVGPETETSGDIESWCNHFAAEILVPLDHLKEIYNGENDLDDELNRLARIYKVSSLVILRRIYDMGHLTREEFWNEFDTRMKDLVGKGGSTGGNFYNTQSTRLGRLFPRALLTSTLEGNTLYHEAFKLLGFTKMSTFRDLSHHLGVG